MDGEAEAEIRQSCEAITATVPALLEDSRANAAAWGIRDPQEYTYGLVTGMLMASATAIMMSRDDTSEETREEAMGIVYRHSPAIRERIFGGES